MSIIEFIQVVFYGIVEGITEWLPVSSTGHLILFESLWPMNVSDDFLSMFRVVIQLGAILAVCVLYFDRLNPFSKAHSQAKKSEIWGIWGKVIVGCLPAAILGVLLDDFLDEHFYKWPVVAATLIIYGVAFIVVENRNRGIRPKIRSFRQMSYRTAFLIGMFQVLSLIPGTSRSGATILGGILMGTSRTVAAEFSFFMAIPIMFGASFLKLLKYVLKVGFGFSVFELACLVIGMLTAFIVSLAVIRFLMGFVQRHNFKIFGYYRIALGVIVILAALLFPGLLPS